MISKMAIASTVIYFVLGLSITFGAKNRKCFAPVYCSDDELARPEWLQVFPRPKCKLHISKNGSTEVVNYGPQGKQGPQGLQGIRGEKGEQGIANTTITDELRKQIDSLQGILLTKEKEFSASILKLEETLKIKDQEIEKLQTDMETQKKNFGLELETKTKSVSEALETRISRLEQATRSQGVALNSLSGLDGRVRLVNGNSTGGRVEIFHNNEWGTICNDMWDENDATVICNMLGLGRPKFWSPVQNNKTYPLVYGQGTGKIWLDGTNCLGYEWSITNCTTNAWGDHNCHHHEDVGVTCT